MVAIDNRILKIDTTKVGKGKMFSAEEPLKCLIDKLVDGVQLVGNHDGEITELSMCQWMKSRLASASVDGMVGVLIFIPQLALPSSSLIFFVLLIYRIRDCCFQMSPQTSNL